MSRDNLGNKQTLILHDCLIKKERYDFIIKQQRKKIGYLRSKKQPKKKAIITKQKEIIKLKTSRDVFSNQKLQHHHSKNASIK